jgi:hypothetical protein
MPQCLRFAGSYRTGTRCQIVRMHLPGSQGVSEVLQHRSSEMLQHRSSEMLQHISSEVLQHRSSEMLQHRSSEVSQHRSSEVLQHRSSEVLQHRSSEVLQHRSSEMSQHRSSEILQRLIFPVPMPTWILVNSARGQRYLRLLEEMDGFGDINFACALSCSNSCNSSWGINFLRGMNSAGWCWTTSFCSMKPSNPAPKLMWSSSSSLSSSGKSSLYFSSLSASFLANWNSQWSHVLYLTIQQTEADGCHVCLNLQPILVFLLMFCV